ncbi:MAG: hypothetical protein ABIS50_20450 [Luteolibacter sp.]|uniref:hypothetical protein n=1 Tax=Luteolibacter sp. TaxID=1962973 RepID=UPI0032630C27
MITVEHLANLAISACEATDAPYMLTGALAYNYYAIPRSTKDVDIVVNITEPGTMERIIQVLEPQIIFSPQVQFDTITWGRRHIGRPPEDTGLSVELFELFEDPFVSAQFERRKRFFSQALDREVWLPSAEDIVTQKIRWGRSKDLDDARDVLAVQGPETLDMTYIRNWCATHGTTQRLETILESLPPL